MFDKIMTIVVLTLSVATITYLLPDMLYDNAPIHLIAYTLSCQMHKRKLSVGLTIKLDSL